MWKEFKAFVMRGNVIDLAVGVILGAAFGAIVKSLVDDVIMPVVGLGTGKMDFSEQYALIRAGTASPPPYPTLAAARAAGAVVIAYGSFVNSIITFLIVAMAVFMLVKAVNKMYHKPADPTADTRPCPYCTMSVSRAATRCPNCTSQLTVAA